MVTKTSGTTIMRVSRIKRSPIQPIASAPGPHTEPSNAPITIAVRMRFHSAISNHVCVMLLFFAVLSMLTPVRHS